MESNFFLFPYFLMYTCPFPPVIKMLFFRMLDKERMFIIEGVDSHFMVLIRLQQEATVVWGLPLNLASHFALFFVI